VLYVPHFGDEIKEPGKEDDDGEDNEEFEADEDAASTVDNPGDEDEDEDESEDGKKKAADREVDYEEVIASYVFWEDYREGAARKWREVPWVRYRSYLTREELIERFGKEKGGKVNLDYSPKGYGSETTKDVPPLDIYKKAIVHEVWDKIKLEAVWYAPGTPDLILDTRADPLKLPDFFPNPDPLRSTTTNDKRTPVADYSEYQDQARELDTLTARIDRLTRALKVSGVYAGEEKQVLQQLVDEGTENRLIPVGDAMAWADKGGLSKIIEWMPIQQVAETLIQLYNARDRVKAVLYELTGIGDIMRGMTEPDETLGAQELKANFSTRRITPQQKKVAKFARNLLRLMASVVAEHFQAKTISMITGYPQLAPVPPVPPRPMQPQLPPPMQPAMIGGAAQPAAPSPPGAGPPAAVPNGPAAGGPPGQPGAPPAPPPNPAMQAYQQQMAQWQQAAQAAQAVQQQNQQLQQQFDAAVALIKSDGVHGFRIDIEADSTIAPDEQAEKTSRVEFMEKFVPFLEQIVPLSQGNPAAAEMAEQMTLFVMRGFRVARPLEETVTKFFASLSKMPPPPPKGGGKASGVDSPADLALRAKEQTDKDSIERQKLALQQEQFTESEATKRMQVLTQEKNQHDRLGLDVAHMAKSDALAGARLTHIETRDASSLT
jgi:hypothetical protein